MKSEASVYLMGRPTSPVIRTAWSGSGQTERSMEQNSEPRNRPHEDAQQAFEGGRTDSVREESLSTKGAEQLDIQRQKKTTKNLHLTSHHI